MKTYGLIDVCFKIDFFGIADNINELEVDVDKPYKSLIFGDSFLLKCIVSHEPSRILVCFVFLLESKKRVINA